jgi:hypothetical protein
MKTLYESILDDEDVLIQSTRDSINDPFKIFADIVKSDMSKDEFEKSVDIMFKDFITNTLNIDDNNLKWEVYSFTSRIKSVYLRDPESDDYLLALRYLFYDKALEVSIAKKNSEISEFYGIERKSYSKIYKKFRDSGFRAIKNGSSWQDPEHALYLMYIL